MTSAGGQPSAAAAGPLAGVRVIDVTMNMSGPLATMLLADQGADVVKIEPPSGDVIRQVGTSVGDTSPYFGNLNRNKRSVVVDLQQDAGREVVQRLVAASDVFVQNLRHGVADRLGLGSEALRARNPRLIHVSISGFGSTGPLAELPAYDHIVQALSGIAARQSDPEGRRSLVRQGVIDKATAYLAAQAISTALFARERTGEGASIELSLLDAALSFLWPDGMMGYTGLDPSVADGRDIARSFRTTETADGDIVVVTLTDAQWRGLMTAVGLDDRGDDSIAARQRRGGDVMREVARRLRGMRRDEAVEVLRANGVPSAAVVELTDVHAEPQVVAAGSLVEYEHPVVGPVRQPHAAARFAGDARESPRPAPGLGEHTDAVLHEVGFGDDEIAALRAAGVLGT
jgi:crotonobetainyl-CoA:carnitine CoA-transferase CaiB-like acyl-CoA transferase